MNQKPSVVQIIKSVPQVLTSDTPARKAAKMPMPEISIMCFHVR